MTNVYVVLRINDGDVYVSDVYEDEESANNHVAFDRAIDDKDNVWYQTANFIKNKGENDNGE